MNLCASLPNKNIPCKNEIRIVIGCDEERTMEDIRYYIRKAGEPAFAFTPDGKFPFSLGEKGALMWHISGGFKTCISTLVGGVQYNVVSPKAEAVLNSDENYDEYKKVLAEKKYTGNVQKEAGKLRILIHGKAAHASRPQDGKNATVQLLDLIQTVDKDPLAELLFRCFCDYNGKGGNIDYDIEPMGKLTINLGILKIIENTVSADVDCRYPYGISSEIITEHVKDVLKPLEVELVYDDKPTLADISSPYIQSILHSYRRVSNDSTSEPIISGGVTYSKAIGNCVAFGPMTEQGISLAHQANEKIYTNKIDTLFKIYTEAMIQLGNI
jgi:succinyl-diaminopimelate desuccinylase